MGEHADAVTYLGLSPLGAELSAPTDLSREAQKQLDAYFAGTLRQFDLPLAPRGTAFQQQVWRVLQSIPWGHTLSYAEVAAQAGRPAAYRAAGGACGRNPVIILIPCHRVLAAKGALGGYSGGLNVKRYLLKLEGISHR